MNPVSTPTRAPTCPSTTRRRKSAATPVSRPAGPAPRDGDSAETLVLEDAYVRGLERADSADVLFYRAERFDDPPDYFVAGTRPRRPRPGDRDQPLHRRGGVGPRGTGRLRERIGSRPPVRPPLPANYEEGGAVPHDRVHLRDPLPGRCTSSRSPASGTTTTTRPGPSTGYAVLLPGHRVPGAGSGRECAGVRARGGGEGRRDGGDGPGRGRAHRALVGRLPGDVPAHPDRHLRGFRGRRAAHRLRELHGPVALEPGHRRTEPLGDRAGAHGGAVLGGPGRAPPEFADPRGA